ncbi:MAG: hypothetical protein ACK4V6_14690 [Microthrixaceae bacterium]
MARKNPLGKIKDVAAAGLKAPLAAAGSAVDLAKGAGAMGGHTIKSAAGQAAGAATSLIGGRKSSDAPKPSSSEHQSRPDSHPAAPKPASPSQPDGPKPAKRPAAKKAPAKAKSATGQAAPVNVTAELGLDPAPVEQPKPKKASAKKKPATKIDAAADPSGVDATPADLAKVLSEEKPTEGR